MVIIKEYFDSDLIDGECRSCNEETRIVKGDGRCPDCIEEQAFYEMTMKQSNRFDDND